MTDRTPTDIEAIDLMAAAFTAKVKQHPMPRDPYPYAFSPLSASFFGCSTEEALAVALDALPAGLHRQLADQKDGGPLFEGTGYELWEWLTPALDDDRRVVVYPAAEGPA